MELNLVILLFVVLNHKNWNQQQLWTETFVRALHFFEQDFFLYSFSNVESKILSSKFDCNSDSKVNKGLQHDTWNGIESSFLTNWSQTIVLWIVYENLLMILSDMML